MVGIRMSGSSFISLKIVFLETHGHGFRLHGRQDDMVAVSDDDGSGLAPLGGVQQLSRFAGFFLEPFHGRRIGGEHGHDSGRHHHVSETNLDQPVLHAYSTFWICSRIFSRSLLMETTY